MCLLLPTIPTVSPRQLPEASPPGEMVAAFSWRMRVTRLRFLHDMMAFENGFHGEMLKGNTAIKSLENSVNRC